MEPKELEVIETMARNIGRIADAICPFTAIPGKDAAGGHVASLTEAVMGMTSGLVLIGEAIESLAEAVGNRD